MFSYTHPQVPVSNHIINCDRCKQQLPEAGSIEAFTRYGEAVWELCDSCVVDLTLFIAGTGGSMWNTNVIITYGENDDVDVAEHHEQCACVDCIIFDGQYEPDADEQVKFWKENSEPDWAFERRSA